MDAKQEAGADQYPFDKVAPRDLVVRVYIDETADEQQQQPDSPAAKRPRRGTVAAELSVEIGTHAAVLSTCSAYFQQMLHGEWAEAAARRVELGVADERAMRDVRLLIDLSYDGSYRAVDCVCVVREEDSSR